MPIVSGLIQRKGDEVASLPPTATVLEAAQLMNERHIGSVLVAKKGQLIGIFTERDVMRRIVAEQRDPSTCPLSEVMTTGVVCAAPHTPLNEIRRVMRDRHIRHLPVVDGANVLGVISIGDLNKAEHDTQEATILYLEQYMSVA